MNGKKKSVVYTSEGLYTKITEIKETILDFGDFFVFTLGNRYNELVDMIVFPVIPVENKECNIVWVNCQNAFLNAVEVISQAGLSAYTFRRSQVGSILQEDGGFQ